MISRIVSFALSQRFIVLMAALMLMVWGAYSFSKLPIDAYPDLSPPHVEIITQWPGHASEEIERLISIPLEVEMNGIPKIESLRSISLYGLSALEMNFQYDIDPYFVREQAFERMADATLPDGVTPGVSPLFSPSGLIYRYVLVSPDQTPQQLKTIEAWVLERKYRSDSRRRRRFRSGRHHHAVSGAAESQPAVLAGSHGSAGVSATGAATTPTPAADSIRKAGSSITFAVWDW